MGYESDSESVIKKVKERKDFVIYDSDDINQIGKSYILEDREVLAITLRSKQMLREEGTLNDQNSE